MKIYKTRKLRAIPFCRVQTGEYFVFEKQKYMKFRLGQGITAKGRVISLADNALVTPVKK